MGSVLACLFVFSIPLWIIFAGYLDEWQVKRYYAKRRLKLGLGVKQVKSTIVVEVDNGVQEQD